MFKGLYLNKIHMHTNDYCNVRLARNVKVQGSRFLYLSHNKLYRV